MEYKTVTTHLYRNVANFDISAQLYIYLTNNGMKTFNITKLCTVHIVERHCYCLFIYPSKQTSVADSDL